MLVSTRARLRCQRLVAAVLLASAVTSGSLAVAAPASATTVGQQAVREASRHQGQAYQYGSAGPSRFDCSGLTMYVFKRLGRSLPHSSASQYNAPGVRHVSRSQLAAGDLVFTIRDGKIRHVFGRVS
jgi:cell wall-associated NlpC family hydrolase